MLSTKRTVEVCVSVYIVTLHYYIISTLLTLMLRGDLVYPNSGLLCSYFLVGINVHVTGSKLQYSSGTTTKLRTDSFHQLHGREVHACNNLIAGHHRHQYRDNTYLIISILNVNYHKASAREIFCTFMLYIFYILTGTALLSSVS